MKNKNKFSSYGAALKKLEFLTEQEELQEATKYVLKQQPKPQEEAPAPIPTNEPSAMPATPDPTALDTPDADTGDDFGAEDPTVGTEDPNDYMKVIQKMTGKLTQKLDIYKDKLESNDIKYVINMILGSVDLDKLDDADETEILDNFDEEPNPEANASGDEMGGSEVPPSEDDLGEVQVDGMDALEELINTPFDDDTSVFDDDDEIDSPDIRDFEDKKASKFAEKDFEKENPHMDDDEEDMDSPLDPQKDDYRPDDEEEDDERVKELDIDELTNMVNTTVKDSLSKYFS